MAFSACVVLLVVFLSVFALSFVESVLGILLAHFSATRWCGIRLWALSGLFLKWLPKVCPADRCAHCNNWTCPRFHDTVKK